MTWLPTLTTALDMLENAISSHGDTTATLTHATTLLAQLEASLPTLPKPEQTTLKTHLPTLLARLNVLTARMEDAQGTVGTQLRAQRTTHAAFRSYGGTPK
ncbi:MAG: hypothetical protein WAZ18_02860 [Alphaproteobacteria bacterium]